MNGEVRCIYVLAGGSINTLEDIPAFVSRKADLGFQRVFIYLNKS